MADKIRIRGQAFLSLVLLMGGAMLLIGVTLTFIAVSFIDMGYGYQAVVQAESIANSGAEDALLQLDRNIAFGNTGGYTYVLPVGSSTANVTVTQNNTGFASNPGVGLTATILSSASVANRTRNVTVIVALNATTSQVTVMSWQVTP